MPTQHPTRYEVIAGVFMLVILVFRDPLLAWFIRETDVTRGHLLLALVLGVAGIIATTFAVGAYLQNHFGRLVAFTLVASVFAAYLAIEVVWLFG